MLHGAPPFEVLRPAMLAEPSSALVCPGGIHTLKTTLALATAVFPFSAVQPLFPNEIPLLLALGA